MLWLLGLVVWMTSGFFASAAELAQENMEFPYLKDPFWDKMFWFSFGPALGLPALIISFGRTEGFKYGFCFPWTKY